MSEVYIDQCNIEMTWSKRQGMSIVKEEVKDIPVEYIKGIKKVLARNIKDFELIDRTYDMLMYCLFAKDVDIPLQAITTQIGMVAGKENKIDALLLGITIIKSAEDVGLYRLERRDSNGEYYVIPKFKLQHTARNKIAELQYLPPMKMKPRDWNSNTDGGWMKENRHIILGKSLGKHNEFQCYDAVNKLQKVAFKIDTETYITEKNTNHNMKKQPFLRTIKEYLDKEFYFVWQYDTRGRMYSSGYHLNIQTNEYGKALLEFANKEYVTKLDNLYIAIAGHAGKDKLTWQERIDWVKSLNGDFSSVEWEEPMLGRKAVRALEDTLAGKPTGYMMGIDSTSSGIQLMAVLSGCKETARYTNLVDSSKRYDVYTEVLNVMNESLDTNNIVTRKACKRSLMTHYYNSKSTPKSLMNEQQLEVFYKSLEGMLPGAEDVMNVINSAWNYEGTEHSWTMPDGHKVIVPVVEPKDYIIEDSELGSIPFRCYEKTPSENFRSLSPNILHSIDAYVAREMIRRCDFQMVHIHDNFLCSPDHIQDMCRIYREILADIAQMDLLQHILREISGNHSYVYHKFSDDLHVDILNSSYALS